LRARKLIEDEEKDLLFSALSIMEIGTKATIHKLVINASVVANEDTRRRYCFDCRLACVAAQAIAIPIPRRPPLSLFRETRRQSQ
jgi:PIN domain nuclease of toxin-antitoxin system